MPPDPFDLFRTESTAFLHAFQHIEVTPQASVHAPYMLLSVNILDNPEVHERMLPHHRMRLERVRAARAAASPPIRALLERHFYDEGGRETTLARGRAEMPAIRALLREAVALGLADAQQGGAALRDWLKTYGIGLDCASFVQQALAHLRLTCLDGGGPEIPLLRCPWVHRALTASGARPSQFFHRIDLPEQARPGDLIVNPLHMRLVVSVQPDGAGTIFQLTESTSASDIPAGQTSEDSDIGPRLIQTRYPRGDQPISSQIPQVKRAWEPEFRPEESESSYVIGRFW